MMNVDNLMGKGLDKAWFQDLHITSQNQEIHCIAKKVEHAPQVVSAVFLPNGKEVVGNMIHMGKRFQVLVITENARDIHHQRRAFPVPEQIRETVI